MQSDAVVLGAGIVGVSVALHLQARGRSVVLVDRRGPGEETSYGNAGLIERSSVVPYAFPRRLPLLLRYGLNRSLAARYDPKFLPRIAPWLFQYWRHSAPARLAEAARAMLPLIESCVAEHAELMQAAGSSSLMRRTGWIEVFRTGRALREAIAETEALSPYGLVFDVLDTSQLREREPGLAADLAGAIHWRDAVSVASPGEVTKSYARLFEARGGQLVQGDALTLEESGGGWSVATANGRVEARDAVVALGPWSNDITERLGYRIPLAVKRGYHMHYAAAGPPLVHPILDAERGYVLAPMQQGIRLTTGVEFAARDAPPTPVQIDRCEPVARQIFPLGARLDAQPWMGLRPALPDMRPVIGPAPRHNGLWLAFGHTHHGFTLGPVTGRLLAEMMTGGETIVDPAPYAAGRFRR